jgi:hypothetical protein
VRGSSPLQCFYINMKNVLVSSLFHNEFISCPIRHNLKFLEIGIYTLPTHFEIVYQRCDFTSHFKDVSLKSAVFSHYISISMCFPLLC